MDGQRVQMALRLIPRGVHLHYSVPALFVPFPRGVWPPDHLPPALASSPVRPSDASGTVTWGVPDSLTKLRDMRCAQMLAHAEALMERGMAVMSEGSDRDNVFLDGQAGQG